jgi:hypothetical protein
MEESKGFTSYESGPAMANSDTFLAGPSIGPMIHRADLSPPHGKDVLRVRYAAAIDRHITQASSAVYACLFNKLDKLLCRLGPS